MLAVTVAIISCYFNTKPEPIGGEKDALTAGVETDFHREIIGGRCI